MEPLLRPQVRGGGPQATSDLWSIYFEISGPVRSFFSNLCLFSGMFLLPVGVLWEVLGGLGGLRGPV